MKLSVIIPCYEEEENVNIFYDEFTKAFKQFNYKYELIFVNDGSSDNTFNELKKICKRSKEKMKVINFSRNFGKEAAIYAGIIEASGDYVSLIDADLQQRPEVLLEMVNFLEKNDNYDCVCAYQDVRSEGRVLHFLKNCFYKIINAISDVDFVLGASDFRVFKKSVRDAIVEVEEHERFTKGIFSFVGFNTHFMQYRAEERINGKSKWSFLRLFKYAISGIIAFSTLPLKLATYLGGFTIIGSLIYLIISIALKVELTTTMLFFLISFFSGIQLLFIGFLSYYLAFTYSEVKKRPIYIIKDYIKSDEKEV